MSQGKTINIPKERLYKLYIIQNLTISQLMIRFGCTRFTILKKLNDYGIKKKEVVN